MVFNQKVLKSTSLISLIGGHKSQESDCDPQTVTFEMNVLIVFLSLVSLAFSAFELAPSLNPRNCWSCTSIIDYVKWYCYNQNQWDNNCPEAREEMRQRCLPCNVNTHCYKACKREICQQIENNWHLVVIMLKHRASSSDVCGAGPLHIDQYCGPQAKKGCD
ncbi:hypothetical protein L596_026255 [Steinernema carpocapsae]|uniref:Uncharacterized protein n=1 Tax=Steinernema carpocapsae TaxID=34508 RepID=A0A4U5M0T0_STECR|nr:hypothetical protein L596_026255 [Steinernema carpocapsae]